MRVGNRKEHKDLYAEEEHWMGAAFEDFIVAQDHPCVMAQSVFKQHHQDFKVYEGLGSLETAEKILRDLKNYLSRYDFESKEFFSFLAAFKGAEALTEKEFEDKLWQQLQAIHQLDEVAWDAAVSSEPESRNFSFSISGKAFYLVGMHPGSSRKARQSPFPVLVFNLHWQFERLREMGAYHTVRDKIRDRDLQLQGSINPMLEDFGNKSEASQYSGRAVGEAWKCPFTKK